MAARKGPRGETDIGGRLAQAGGRHDLAHDPGGEWLAGYRLGDQSEQAVAVVGILEPLCGPQWLRDGKIGLQFGGRKERTTVRKSAGVRAVPDEAPAVR